MISAWPSACGEVALCTAEPPFGHVVAAAPSRWVAPAGARVVGAGLFDSDGRPGLAARATTTGAAVGIAAVLLGPPNTPVRPLGSRRRDALTVCALAGVYGHVEAGDESVAQVSGGLVAQRPLGDQVAGGGRDVVAFVVSLLQDAGRGSPVGLRGQPRVQPGGQVEPPVRRRCCGRRFEPGAYVVAVLKLDAGGRAGVVVPGLDGRVELAAQLLGRDLQVGRNLLEPGVPGPAGTGGEDLEGRLPGLLGVQVLETLEEERVAQRVCADKGAGERGRTAAGEQVGGA